MEGSVNRLTDDGESACRRGTGHRYQGHFELLLDAFDAGKFEAVGNPVWACYEPPFKPWFMRRSEILAEFEVEH